MPDTAAMPAPRLRDRLGLGDAFAGYEVEAGRVDMQGWNSAHPFFAVAIRLVQPQVVIELGVWKGMSTIEMARLMKAEGIDGEILAVDTWLGSSGHLSQAGRRDELRPVQGYPTLYRTFLANVATAGHTDVVTPLAMDGTSAAVALARQGVRARIIPIHAGHAYAAPAAGLPRQQSQIRVPMDAPGVKLLRHLPVFGYDDAPHGHAEVLLEDVRVPASNMILGEGRGFEIAQGRLGPGRIHHCMRLIGLAERSLEAMCRRVPSPGAFGPPVGAQTGTPQRLAQSRIGIEPLAELTLYAAWKMDTAGNKEARAEIAMIKVAAPNMALRVIDRAIQAHGGGGVTSDFGLARAWAGARTLRLADGPDEVHRNQIARLELKKHPAAAR